MNIKPIITGLGISLASAIGYVSVAAAEDIPIIGNVQAKCSIFTDTAGVYGNPTPNELSTESADGGISPVIRFDVAQADYYTARIRYPLSFSTAPTLVDTVTWTGSTTVSNTSDVNMAGYEAAKVEFDNATEYDLSVAGTTWFSVTSTATYGFNTAFPAGTYTSIVEAECIAN
jgi:hypothetical protein